MSKDKEPKEEEAEKKKTSKEVKEEKKKFYETVSKGLMWDYHQKKTVPGRVWKKNTPKELLKEIKRSMTDEELKNSQKIMGLFNESTLKKNKDNKPSGVLLVGVGGSGKSSIYKKLEKYDPTFDIKNYVIFDGDLLRENHKGWLECIKDPKIGYQDAWKNLKPNIAAGKAKIFRERILPEKRNVIIATGVHGLNYFQKLLNNDYVVDVFGIFVTWEEGYHRGLNRAQITGRSYIGTKEMWDIAKRDMWDLTSRKETRRSFILDNTDFDNPILLYKRNINIS